MLGCATRSCRMRGESTAESWITCRIGVLLWVRCAHPPRCVWVGESIPRREFLSPREISSYGCICFMMNVGDCSGARPGAVGCGGSPLPSHESPASRQGVSPRISAYLLVLLPVSITPCITPRIYYSPYYSPCLLLPVYISPRIYYSPHLA